MNTSPPGQFVPASADPLDRMSAREFITRQADRFYVRAQLYSKLADVSTGDPRECGHKASELMFLADELRDVLAGRKPLEEVC